MRRKRNESTVLHAIRAAPWRRGAPKAQDGCASKRHPSTQRSVWQLCKALLRIVIGSEFEGSLPHSYASKCVCRETKARYYMQYEQPLGEGARRRRRIDVPRRGTLLRSGQYANCAKRYSVSSSEANSRDLCLTRMRVNAYAEKRKHGITCNTSRPLEKGRAEGAGWMCLEEAPSYAAVSMTTVQSAAPYRQRKRSEKSLSFAVSRSMIGNSKRETCYPLTFGHRPIYIAAKLPPQP